jgi:hypothetical protein
MTDRLREAVESALDEAIRSFDSLDREAQHQWDSTLRRLEQQVTETLPADRELLARIRAQRILMAFDVGELQTALNTSQEYLREFNLDLPSSSVVAAARIAALHRIGAHLQEIEESLDLAVREEIRGSEFVFLLERLARHHPECLRNSNHLREKLQRVVVELRLIYEELEDSTSWEPDLEHFSIQVAESLRRASQRRALAVLGGESPW